MKHRNITSIILSLFNYIQVICKSIQLTSEFLIYNNQWIEKKIKTMYLQIIEQTLKLTFIISHKNHIHFSLNKQN